MRAEIYACRRRKTETKSFEKIVSKSANLPYGIELTQFIYLLLSIFITFSFILNLFNLNQIGFEIVWLGLLTIIYWALFYGTYKIRSWVVILVLFYSIFASISGFINIISFHPVSHIDYTKKVFQILLCSFFLFQIAIFSKRTTRHYFEK